MGQRGKRARGTGNNDYKGKGNGRPPEDTAYKHSTRSGQVEKLKRIATWAERDKKMCRRGLERGKCDKEKKGENRAS